MAASAKVTPSHHDPVAGEVATALKHSFIYGFGGFLVKGASLFLLPLYTHFLSPADYGVFEVLELSTSLLGMFLNMGITAALLRYYGAAKTDEERRKIVGSTFLLTVGTSALIFIIASLSVRKASALLLGPSVPASYLFLSFIGFLIAYLANVPYTTLRAKEKSTTVVTIDTLTLTGILVLNVYFIAFLKMSVLGMLLSRVIVNSIAIVVLIKFAGPELFGGMDWTVLRRVVVFGSPLIFSNLTMFTLNFADRFFLQRFQSLEVVGVYAVGYKFGYLLNVLLIQPFTMMWQARMYIVYQRPDHQKVFARIFVLYSAVLIFVGLTMAVFGPRFMGLVVDSRYAGAAVVIPMVALSYVFLGMAYYLQLGMYLTSKTGLVGTISTVAAILNLAANYFLIKYFSLVGAAWATVIGFLAITVGSYYCSERVCPLALPVGRVARAILLAAALYGVSRFLPLASLPVELLVRSLLMAGFLLALWLTGCFSSDELATIGSLQTSAVRMLRPAWMRS